MNLLPANRNLFSVLLPCFAVCLTGVCLAQAKDFYKAEYGALPNHLTPVPAQLERDSKITGRLYVTRGELGRMLVRPSFKPEYCLSVWAEIPAAAIQKHREIVAVPDEEKTYFITVTTASTNLSFAFSREVAEGKPRDVNIARVDKRISLELAVAIQRVWSKALLLTRYPRNPGSTWLVLDPTTYQFSVELPGYGELHGETFGAEGLSRKLAEVGLDLVKFAQQQPNEKTLTEAQLTKMLKKLEATIPKPAR